MFLSECGSDKTRQSFSRGSDLSSTLRVLEDGCKSPARVCVWRGGGGREVGREVERGIV